MSAQTSGAAPFPSAAALEEELVRQLTRRASAQGQVVDLVVAGAKLWAESPVADTPDGRAVLVAMLARDLQQAIDMPPAGWAVLVAELALQVAERGDVQGVRELES